MVSLGNYLHFPSLSTSLKTVSLIGSTISKEILIPNLYLLAMIIAKKALVTLLRPTFLNMALVPWVLLINFALALSGISQKGKKCFFLPQQKT